MTDNDWKLLKELNAGIITSKQVLNKFSVRITDNPDFIRDEVRNAIMTSYPDKIDLAITLIWLSDNVPAFVDVLNELLINPDHRRHQEIAKKLQDYAPSPTTVPFVRKILESNFDYLEYTCSESGSIAKWFSYLLSYIGTQEAVELMKEYCNSEDEGIREEMLYRLNKFFKDSL
jgi:hypothetical protein